MKKMCVVGMVLFMVFVFSAAEVLAAPAAFGRVYDVSGTVTLKRSGTVKNLTKAQSLLQPVQEGDEISVKDGRLVVMSFKDKKGYEIGANSTVKVGKTELQKVTGSVKAIAGLRSSKDSEDTEGMRPGALVLRGARHCIKVVSPANTTVLSTSPDLKWEVICDDLGKVKVEIMEDKGPAGGSVMKMLAETDKTFLKVSDNTLEYGKKYRWTVDGGMGKERAVGRFSIPAKEKADALKKNIDELAMYDNDLAKRVSYIFFLQDNELNDMATVEIAKLKKEFAGNEYVKDLFE